jgi:hypothetical protein
MQILYAPGFMAAIIFVLVTSSVTGNAVVLYPWCAKRSRRIWPCQLWIRNLPAVLGNARRKRGTCAPNPLYQPYPPPTTYSPPIRR